MFSPASHSKTGSALPTFRANRTLYPTAVRFYDRLFTLHVIALCLAGRVASGMPNMPGPSENFL